MLRNIDIDLLRAFTTIYEAGSFSHAAERLGRTQSTISQQIKKLEEILGRDVFLRTNRSISLTTEGEILLPYARRMIDMNDEVLGRISKPDISGTVKLGAPEAFAANHLPSVLAQFAKSHPCVGLEIHCDLTSHLFDGFEKGDFDLILFKRSNKTKTYGHRIWHESLVWVGAEKNAYHMGDTVPLVISPNPCVYREKITEALNKKNIKWSPVFTSTSMTGRIAAARAGLGITAIPKELLSQTHGLFALGETSGLPKLQAIEIAMLENETGMSDAAKRLAEHITFMLENDPSIKHNLN